MTKTWKHPALGEFTFDGYAWKTLVDAPAFKIFNYGHGRPPTGRVELSIPADNESDLPPADVLALISKVLAEQDRLVSAVTAALWDDFNGHGPYSGMWWHGHLGEVTQEVDPALPPLTSPDALFRWMRLSAIEGRKSGRRNEMPAVELKFEAPFEEEHGVGVLTDGISILGTGYSHDVGPFMK